MSSTLLLNSDLNSLLETFTLKIHITSDERLIAIFITLFDHGFRISELKGLETWSDLGDGTLACTTLKGGAPRIIQKTLFHPLVLLSVLDGINYVFMYSYSTVERFFSANSGVARFQTGKKNLGTHVFRHNRIKQLDQGGMARPVIQSKFGLSQLTTIDHYADSQIYAHYGIS